MIRFNVTFERINQQEAEAGETNRHGMYEENLTLRDAIYSAQHVAHYRSAHQCTEASDSKPEHARWVSAHYSEWETGDDVTASIHFPRCTTPASAARLVRLLTKTL